MKNVLHSKWSEIACKHLFICFLFIQSVGSNSQDAHFSQFYNFQSVINPAFTGDFEQDFRVSLVYRKQWAAIQKGFTTEGGIAELALLKNKGNTNYLGLGLMVLNDKAGKSQLATFISKGSVAYHLAVDGKNRFSAGLNAGYEQRSINVEGLTWDAQYNGIAYDPSLNSGESFASQSKGMFDAAAGLMWWHSGKSDWKAGYALHHFMQKKSFLVARADKLYWKHVASFNYTTKLPFVFLHFDLLFARQAGAMEINGGVRAEYRMGSDSRYTDVNTSSAVYAGCYYRKSDAISPVVGFEYERMISAFISYDIHISGLNKATNMAGGPEISLVYTGKLRENRMKLK